MRKLKVLWRSGLSPRVCEELENWIGVLLAVGAAAMLYATLRSQAAHASEAALAATAWLAPTMAAGRRSAPGNEAYVHAVLAAGMPPARPSPGSVP